MWRRVCSLMIKEVLTVWRDKRSRFSLLIPPILQLFIFAFAATLDVKNVSIAYLNNDSGKPSFELIQRFLGSPTFTRVRPLRNVEEIAEVIDTQRAVAVLHIDSEFSRNLYANGEAKVQLILDGRKSNTAQIVQGYVSRIVQQFNVDFAIENRLSLSPTVLVTRNWFNPNLLYYWFNVPNLLGLLTMLITMIITSLSVAREREIGTFDQLLVSPLNPLEILLGKALPALVISLAEATFILFIAIVLFRIPFEGSLLVLYACLAVFISSIVGIGLFISSMVKTQQQAVLGTFIFLSPAILLSGYATPVENMPRWLQVINVVNPLQYFLVIAKGIFLKDMPLSIILQYTWPMAVIALFTFFGAALFFHKRLE